MGKRDRGDVVALASLACTQLAGAAGSGSFSAARNLSVDRAAPIAVTLRDGRVLVAGGGAGSFAEDVLDSSEIFDPGTGAFSPSAPLAHKRSGAVAARLPDGRVLVAGGFDGTSVRKIRIPLRLSKRGRRFLRHGRLAMKLRITFSPQGGLPRTKTKRLRPRA